MQHGRLTHLQETVFYQKAHENVFYQKAHELRCFVDNQFIKCRRELSSQSCNCLRKFVLFILFSVIYLIREKWDTDKHRVQTLHFIFKLLNSQLTEFLLSLLSFVDYI